MTSVDTNVVIRLLMADDAAQTAAARAFFAGGPVWIAKTVWLETAWVLGSHYQLDERQIREALTELLGFPNVIGEDKASIAAALELTEHGIELADAMHLTSRPSGAAFVSFDRQFVRRSKRAGVCEIS
jgi:predicted nucleic-acid-binding protein